MTRFGSFLVLLLLLVLTTSVTHAASSPSPKDKCPVCGMFVAKYPDWVVVATFKDSTTYFFDGAKDFFTWYHNMKKFTPSRNQTAISTIFMRDYYHLKHIDARAAYFVIGSDVYGPMGKELVPFEKQSDAQAFLKDHQGKKILRFNDVTPAILKVMD